MNQIDKVLVFDIWGDYAHFRRIETTTSPLTYSIPTGTALAGVVSAILGKERDSYYELFSSKNFKFSIRLLSPLRKVRININLIRTDEGFFLWDIKNAPRSPTPFEFIKEPRYRIYIWLMDKMLQKELKDFLRNHQSFYTPYLGISEMIANFNFVDEFSAELRKSERDEKIHSILKKGKFKLIVEEERTYVKERIPLFMNADRIVQEYADIFFEANAKSLKVKDVMFYKIGEENVVFL